MTTTAAFTKVLVVDDEARICTYLMQLLSSRGYAVTTTTRPRDAVTWLEGGERFPVAILDVVMPDMMGDELARVLRRHQPDIKILFLTGYPVALVQERPVLRVGEAFLEKPFTIQGLFEALALLMTGRIQSHPIAVPRDHRLPTDDPSDR